MEASNPALVALVVLMAFLFEFGLIGVAFFANDKRFSTGEIKIMMGMLFGAVSIVVFFIGAIEAMHRWPVIKHAATKTLAVIERADKR